MSAVMNGPPLRRGGAGNRALHYALLASLLLHAALLVVSLERTASRESAFPAPIVARLAPPAAPPPSSVPPRPEPPPAIEAPRAKPEPPTPASRPAVRHAPVAKPRPLPVPQPKPAPASRAADPEPTASPAIADAPPAAPVAPSGPSATRSDAQATAPAAPAPDTGPVNKYRDDLIAMARRYKRYPRVAIDNNWEGRVVVQMVVGANGMIASLRVTSSSGHDVLDKQALDMIRKTKPLVPIPPAMRGREFPVEIPVNYNLKDQDSG
jgi:protein TonB